MSAWGWKYIINFNYERILDLCGEYMYMYVQDTVKVQISAKNTSESCLALH